jgi:predicted dehydrogenase
MMSAARPRVAVIGTGVMGAFHVRVIAQSERCDLARVIEPDASVGQSLAEKYSTQWRPEADDFADLDAVVIATPTEHHADLVLRALESGVPVLVEKPVTADLATTERLVAAAEERQVPIMCGFVERFNPAILTVQSMVSEPVHVTAVRHSPYANRIRTGVAWDLLIHDVDACLRFLGHEPVQVRAGLGCFHPSSGEGSEDVAEAVMSFGSGAVATASASRIGQRKLRSMSIGELNRTIEVDLLRRDVTIYRHVSADSGAHGDLGYRQQTIIEIPQLVSAREPLAAQLDHFLDLAAGSADLKEERESILPAHRVIHQVTESNC